MSARLRRASLIHLAIAISIAIPCLSRAGESISLFNGKDLAGWKLTNAERSAWTVGRAAMDPKRLEGLKVDQSGAELINQAAAGQGSDIRTIREFGDALIELEVMVPKDSNSGIYLQGEYELQICDSYGKAKLELDDMGALYHIAIPTVNACKAPGEWQQLTIDFRAPRFDDAGKKIKNARVVKATLNGHAIHENIELSGPTAEGLTGQDVPMGPLRIQGNHGPVAYRNIQLTPVGN